MFTQDKSKLLVFVLDVIQLLRSSGILEFQVNLTDPGPFEVCRSAENLTDENSNGTIGDELADMLGLEVENQSDIDKYKSLVWDGGNDCVCETVYLKDANGNIVVTEVNDTVLVDWVTNVNLKNAGTYYLRAILRNDIEQKAAVGGIICTKSNSQGNCIEIDTCKTEAPITVQDDPFQISVSVTVVEFTRPNLSEVESPGTASASLESIMGNPATGSSENQITIPVGGKYKGGSYNILPGDDDDLCVAYVKGSFNLKNKITAEAITFDAGLLSNDEADAGYVIRTSLNGLLLDERGASTIENATTGYSVSVGPFGVALPNLIFSGGKSEVSRTDTHPFTQLSESIHTPNTHYPFTLSANTAVYVRATSKNGGNAWANAESNLETRDLDFEWRAYP